MRSQRMLPKCTSLTTQELGPDDDSERIETMSGLRISLFTASEVLSDVRVAFPRVPLLQTDPMLLQTCLTLLQPRLTLLQTTLEISFLYVWECFPSRGL